MLGSKMSVNQVLRARAVRLAPRRAPRGGWRSCGGWQSHALLPLNQSIFFFAKRFRANDCGVGFISFKICVR